MKRKTIVMLTALSMTAVLFAGCGNTTANNVVETSASAEEEVYYADEDFIKDMGLALEARWALTDSQEMEEAEEDMTLGSDKHRELFSSYVQAELNVLEVKDYANANFLDTKLKEKAISYLNCLSDQMEALRYVTVDYDKYAELWAPAFDTRTQLIRDFAENYGLTVSEEYQTTLQDMLTNASLVEENEAKEEAVQALVDSIVFELDEEEYDWYTYKAVVENTLDYDIEYLYIDVNLIDEDGVNIETNWTSIENVSKGEKGRLEFSTNEKFDKIKLTLDSYELK